MKLVTCTNPNSNLNKPEVGLLVGNRVLRLSIALSWFQSSLAGDQNRRSETELGIGESVLEVISNAEKSKGIIERILKAADENVLPAVMSNEALFYDASSCSFLAPIPRPPSMRDGYAFRQHVETARRNRGLEMIPEFDQFPVFYFTNHQAVIGPGDLHVRPMQLDKLDFELEAAIVIGKEGRNISAAEGDSYIFGLTIMNDFSARALQMEEMKLSLGPAKGKDFATALGPALVTFDELEGAIIRTPNGAKFDLEMRAFVNGVQVSRGNVKDMNWTFAQIVERASYGVTLYPGDVIGSGTCGTGCFMELNGSRITDNQWLREGDVVALEIDRLGRLENRVVLDR